MNQRRVIGPCVLLALLLSAPSDWLARFREISYTSQSGDSVSLSRAMGGYTRTFPPGSTPWVKYDRSNGLLLICMWPSLRNQCEHEVYLRAADASVPSGAIPATLRQPAIGMTLSRLLARFPKDPNLGGKSLTKGAHGDVIMVWAVDEDPGPKEYDHGLQLYSWQLYLLCDGIVVAAATQSGEN